LENREKNKKREVKNRKRKQPVYVERALAQKGSESEPASSDGGLEEKEGYYQLSAATKPESTRNQKR